MYNVIHDYWYKINNYGNDKQIQHNIILVGYILSHLDLNLVRTIMIPYKYLHM